MVSIVVPIYNTGEYLERCLDSIKNQSYYNIEVIMVDDGSTDKSAFIAKKYEEFDIRFHLYSQENKGVSAARNNGLNYTMGKYILFVDSDDWIEPEMVKTLVSNMEKSDADVSCCQYDKNVRQDISEIEIWTQKQVLESFIVHEKINGSLVNKLFKRKIIADIKLDENIRYGEDALYVWKALLKVNKVCITNQVLYHVVLHNDSASGGGSYKVIRKDCIKVWQSIAQDAKNISAQLGAMACGQLANMAFFSLYEMIYYNYSDREQETLFLETLKNNYAFMRKAYYIKRSVKYCTLFFLCLPKISKNILKWCLRFKKY